MLYDPFYAFTPAWYASSIAFVKVTSPFCHTRYGTYAIKADFAIQLDLFLDFTPRREQSIPPSLGGEPHPHHVQLELF